jgi:hypothetical protein
MNVNLDRLRKDVGTEEHRAAAARALNVLLDAPLVFFCYGQRIVRPNGLPAEFDHWCDECTNPRCGWVVLVPVEGEGKPEVHDGECDCVQCELAREGEGNP